MRVEVDPRARRATLATSDNIPARMPLGVAGRPLSADELRMELARPKPRGDQLATLAIKIAGGIPRRDADEISGQRGQLVAPRLDLSADALKHARTPRRTQHPNSQPPDS